MGIRQIAKWIKCDRKTVRRILKEKDEVPKARRDKIDIEESLLAELFNRCLGQRERIHEILSKEYSKNIGYSTLTALIKEKNIGSVQKERSFQVPDVPGEEFQHDTSPYTVEIGGQKVKVQASLIYYRYSKMRYLQFYRSFTRFHMKCFFHEALSFFGYVPRTCIIDNTNLAVLRGTGPNAVFVPEMIMFAKQYNFRWKAHAVMHSDRKAGVERSFWFVEKNFFPGRTFSSIDDLNAQAMLWLHEKSKAPTTKKNIIPIDAFNIEKSYMSIVHQGLLGPYRQHRRTVDQYGYVAFNANYFWVPYESKAKEVLVLEFHKTIRIYDDKRKFIEYQLPAEHIRNEKFTPEGIPIQRSPNSLTKSSQGHEEWIRKNLPEITDYLEEGVRANSNYNQRHRFVTGIYNMAKRLSRDLFLETLERAKSFRIYDLNVLDKICTLIMTINNYEVTDTEDNFFNYIDRPEYLEGAESEAPGSDFYERKQRGEL